MLCATLLGTPNGNTLWTERAVRITPTTRAFVAPLTKVPLNAHKHMGLSLTLRDRKSLARSAHTPVSTVDSVVTTLCITA